MLTRLHRTLVERDANARNAPWHDIGACPRSKNGVKVMEKVLIGRQFDILLIIYEESINLEALHPIGSFCTDTSSWLMQMMTVLS